MMIIKTFRMWKALFTVLFLTLALSSCYYDSQEFLYPQASSCDTSAITFAGSVKPVIDNYCVGCHSGGAPSGSVNLDGYQNVYSVAQSGKLVNAIYGTGGLIQMPPGGALSTCDLTKIKTWVKAGAPNN